MAERRLRLLFSVTEYEIHDAEFVCVNKKYNRVNTTDEFHGAKYVRRVTKFAFYATADELHGAEVNRRLLADD